ncbi:class I SAM-dependent methyltransferase [Rhodococcus gannanensis]|uniref:Class I SAM-dependent methyltransferase n=1 Tax=Rhodococcus gannanensis TaxID=1960308 RepID=A0ABW4PA82_9NOCA
MSVSNPANSGSASGAVDALAQRILDAGLGAVDLLSIHVGDRLGWYRSLAADGPSTATELADHTSTHARYAREWLEQQAVTGLLEVDTSDPDTPRFSLPPAAAEVLTDATSLSYLAPLARMFAGSAGQLPALLDAYRTGGGVGWAQFGADARESQADMNRPWYERELAGALDSVPDLHAALRTPGARIADIGCGAGWSTIALARAYPQSRVTGYDIDEPSIAMAVANTGTDVAERVDFHAGSATVLPPSEFDVVFAFECVHDMPDPVGVLAAARRSLRPGGVAVVMDEAVADTFTAPGDETERLMYGFSLFVCLPDGMSHQPSAGTGTVMRPHTLESYATEAGFTGFEILPIENFGLWRFYRLTTTPTTG